MTREEFEKLPLLLTPGQAAACGYALRTLNKYAEAGILKVVRPKGCIQRRFQKRQMAQLLGWEDALDARGWAREKPLLASGAVCQWTGYEQHQLRVMVAAGGLTMVQPGGIGTAKYRKEQVGAWLGLGG